MTKRFFYSKNKVFIVLAVAIVCFAVFCYAFFPRSATGLQLIPELEDVTFVQILHPDWNSPSGIVFEGDDLDEFLAMLSSAEYHRTFRSGSGMVGTVYHIYGYQTFSDGTPTATLFSLFLSDQGILYLNSDKLFCYTVPEDILSFFFALKA